MPRTTRHAVTLVALSLAAGSAHAAITWLGGAASIPDYYQHQLANQARAENPSPLPVPPGAVPGTANYAQDVFWWEGYHDTTGARKGGGWCATTAWMDAIGYWDAAGFRGLVDRSAQGGEHAGKTWLQQFTYSNSALALTEDATDGGCAWISSVRTYVRSNTVSAQRPTGVDPLINRYMWKGGGVQKMTSAEGTEYLNNAGTTGAAEPLFRTMWDILVTSVAHGYTAVIKIGESPNRGPTGDTNNDNWWGNFHVLTLAGFDGGLGAGATIYLADPNDTLRNGTTAAGWGVPYAANAAMPVGQAHYGAFTIGNDGMTITSGAYNGSMIEQVYLMKLPAPGPLALAGLGGLLSCRRRRG
jgi:hypothetical protein